MRDLARIPSITVAIWLISVVVLLGGCGREDNVREPAPETAAPVTGGTVVIALPSEPDVLNSLIRTSSTAGHVLSLIQATLAEMDEDLTWKPHLAESWEVSADSLSITYHLHPWRWSDGRPLHAQDVVTSFELIMNPVIGSPRAALYRDVTGAAALDSHTVRYTFSRPQPRPVERSVHAILPWHVVKDLDPAAVHGWSLNQHPLASGPFRLEVWEHNRQLVLVPNEYYPRERPRLDRVVLRILPDETNRVLALETGEIDVMVDLPQSAVSRLEKSGKVEVYEITGRAFGYVLWNLRRPALADTRVRRALSLAIDRARFVDGIFQGYATPAASFLPPALWNHHVDLPPDPYDPDEARRLLDEAGWSDRNGDGWRERADTPLKIEVLFTGNDHVRRNGTVILRENLQEIGVAVEPLGMEFAVALTRLRSGEFDAYLGEFNANLYADPSPLLHSQAVDKFNFGAYANSAVDSLLERALAIADRREALPVWRRLQEELALDPPAALLYYPRDLVGVSMRIRDVRPHMLSPYNNLHEWWIAPADRMYRGPQ